jgi:enamine deaminase RidA (YjgF/YER057c/UK114 family)
MPTPTRREFRVPGLNEPISHYTDAVSFGDLLFISGVGPLAEDGSLVGPDDPVEQTRRSSATWTGCCRSPAPRPRMSSR